MTTYEGRREGMATDVTADKSPLNPRRDTFAFSKENLDWGYTGLAASQLSLALLVHHLKNGPKALELCDKFKNAVVAHLPEEGWTLTSEEITAIIAKLKSPQHKTNLLPERFGTLTAA